MSLIQMQDHAIARLLNIPPVSKRGSGHLQARMRRAARNEYFDYARNEGYSEKQVLEQWKDIRDMVELEKQAENSN
jgi:hypothetical protein